MFTERRTERLLLRRFREDDAAGLAARRSHPEVARYQGWMLPYPLEQAQRLAAAVAAMDGPADGEWWMAAVCDAATGEMVGDVAVHLTWQGRTAQLGYTFDRDHWGRGYASEASAAMVEYLFDDLGVTRVYATLHLENVASAMVLERCGFLFEGHTKSSYWVGDEVSDDWIYGLVREDWEAWRSRPRHRPDDVRLIEISTHNEQDVYRQRTHKTQEAFVAPMAWSFTDALFPEIVNEAPVVPWMRAVEADGDIVGFVMLALRTEHHPEPYLWRLLIDRLHQRRGIGGRVLELIGAECRAMGDTTLLTSWAEGKGSPRPFYLKHGFEPTGRIVDDETEGRKVLS